MLAARDNRIPVGEELLLAVGRVTGCGAAGRRRQLIDRGGVPIAPSYAKTKSFEGGQIGFHQRLEEESPGKLLVVFKIGIAGIARVAQAVEYAGRVAYTTVKQGSVKFGAKVTIGNEIRRQGALVKGSIRIRLQ